MKSTGIVTAAAGGEPGARGGAWRRCRSRRWWGRRRDRLAELKGCPGHRATSWNMRALLAESEVLKSHTDCDRVQDPYSLRCIPIVHGQVKNALNVMQTMAVEINSVTDNPILFPEMPPVGGALPRHTCLDDDGLPVAAAAVGEEDAAEKSEWDDVAGGHGAVISGHEEPVLLERNAACDMQNKVGRTPLHSASMEGHVAMAKLLLEHNAAVCGVRDVEGHTPLHCAVREESASASYHKR